EHVFCFACLLNWTRVHGARCPVCRADFQGLCHDPCESCDCIRETRNGGVYGVHFASSASRPLSAKGSAAAEDSSDSSDVRARARLAEKMRSIRTQADLADL